jgi:hypothetical protein
MKLNSVQLDSVGEQKPSKEGVWSDHSGGEGEGPTDPNEEKTGQEFEKSANARHSRQGLL